MSSAAQFEQDQGVTVKAFVEKITQQASPAAAAAIVQVCVHEEVPPAANANCLTGHQM